MIETVFWENVRSQCSAAPHLQAEGPRARKLRVVVRPPPAVGAYPAHGHHLVAHAHAGALPQAARSQAADLKRAAVAAHKVNAKGPAAVHMDGNAGGRAARVRGGGRG